MEKNILIDTLRIGVVLVVGAAVLLGSIAKLSWEDLNKVNRKEELRVIPISFDIQKLDGSKTKGEYKIPSPGMLPNSPWYGLKLLRNWLWIKMSPEGSQRTQMMLLVADKSLSEAISLQKRGWERLGWETVKEAVKMLSTTKEEVFDGQLKFQLKQAIMAYQEVVLGFKASLVVDEVDLNKIVTDLKAWNEEI